VAWERGKNNLAVFTKQYFQLKIDSLSTFGLFKHKNYVRKENNFDLPLQTHKQRHLI